MLQSIRILSGLHKNRRLDFMPNKALRPTSQRLKGMVFNILIHRFYPHRVGLSSAIQLEGIKVLDLFAGLGSYGLEALSRGAEHSIFIESSTSVAQNLRGFIQKLGYGPKTSLLCKTLPEEVSVGHKMDLIFLDPPYSFPEDKIRETLDWAQGLLTPKGILVLEFPHEVEVPSGLELVFERKTSRTRLKFFQLPGRSEQEAHFSE